MLNWIKLSAVALDSFAYQDQSQGLVALFTMHCRVLLFRFFFFFFFFFASPPVGKWMRVCAVHCVCHTLQAIALEKVGLCGEICASERRCSTPPSRPRDDEKYRSPRAGLIFPAPSTPFFFFYLRHLSHLFVYSSFCLEKQFSNCHTLKNKKTTVG